MNKMLNGKYVFVPTEQSSEAEAIKLSLNGFHFKSNI